MSLKLKGQYRYADHDCRGLRCLGAQQMGQQGSAFLAFK